MANLSPAQCARARRRAERLLSDIHVHQKKAALGLGADPITASANAITAVANLVSKMIDGQPADVKVKMWEWYVADVERWRKFWKLD